MSSSELVLTEIGSDDGVAVVTLNRPEKKNALNSELIEGLTATLEEIVKRDDVHCIVLQAAGDSFCSGLDLHNLKSDWAEKRKHRGVWGVHGERQGSTMQIVRLLRDARQVTIASVQGYCLGGGLVLMNGCDLAFAAEDAQIGMPEIIRGSYGRSATPTLFHSRVPMKVAFYIQLTGRNLSGVEAARAGLVSQAVPGETLNDYVYDLAKEIATRNPVALEHAKIAAYTQVDLPFDLAIKADDTIGHRMRYYTDPLADVDGYLESQKGGPNLGYRVPKDKL